MQIPMLRLLAATEDDDRRQVKKWLKANAALATAPVAHDTLYEREIVHWLYKGDTALHLAAAGYRLEIVRLLLAAGANANAAQNRRRSGPLHYAADGFITGPAWDEKRQVKTIACLLDAGAAIDTQDANAATALHRATRTQCAAAVEYLLHVGSDPTTRNKTGATAFHLAVQHTGRGGTGTDEAKMAQQQIIAAFISSGANPALKDGKGLSVIDRAKSACIRELLSGDG